MAKKRRKTTEQGDYTVNLKKSDAGAPEETEKTVNAPNAQQAVQKATRGDPKTGTYDEVTIKKDEPGAGQIRTTSQTASQVTANTQGMAGLESLAYPYHVLIPRSFEPLLESLPKKLRESLPAHTRFGKIHISVPDEKVMSTLIESLGKKARGRSKVKKLASTFVQGITESINKQ